MIDLFLSNNRIAVFLEQKKNSNHSKHVKGFPITRGSIVFSIRPDTFGLKDFVNTNLKIILRNLEYNNNSTQNQSVPQLTARNLFGY